MLLVGIDYHGNERSGLVVQCWSNRGCKYRFSFADVQIPPQTIADAIWLLIALKGRIDDMSWANEPDADGES